MKFKKLLLLLLLIPGFVVADSEPGFTVHPATKTPPTNNGFAVVELFTSEGCSSCPPADQLLSRLIAESGTRGTRLYAMAFHVDYWDNRGWKDPYSHHDFTARQVGYSRVFGPGRVYTPQMIVNGAMEFVGSNPMQARRAIARALQTEANGRLSLSAHPVSRNRVLVHYRTQDMPDDTVLHLALVEKALSQQVRYGENAGKTLSHDNVVRAFVTRKGAQGEAWMRIPTGLIATNSEIIGFAQDPASLKIIGASRLDVVTHQEDRHERGG